MSTAPEPAEPRRRTGKWTVNMAVRFSRMPAPARHIMLTLSDIADAGTAEIPPKRKPSTAQLARETGLSISTIKKWRPWLEAEGWLVLTRPEGSALARHERIGYKLTVPPGSAESVLVEGQEPTHGEGRQTTRDEGHEPAPGSDREPGADPREGQETTQARAESRPSSFNDHDDLDDQENRAAPAEGHQPPPTGAAIDAAIDRLCAHLADAVAADGSRRPDPTRPSWRNPIRLMLSVDTLADGRHITEAEIRDAIDYAADDEYFRTSVLHPRALRNQYTAIGKSRARNQQRAKAQESYSPPPFRAPADVRPTAAPDAPDEYRQARIARRDIPLPGGSRPPEGAE